MLEFSFLAADKRRRRNREKSLRYPQAAISVRMEDWSNSKLFAWMPLRSPSESMPNSCSPGRAMSPQKRQHSLARRRPRLTNRTYGRAIGTSISTIARSQKGLGRPRNVPQLPRGRRRLVVCKSLRKMEKRASPNGTGVVGCQQLSPSR